MTIKTPHSIPSMAAALGLSLATACTATTELDRPPEPEPAAEQPRWGSIAPNDAGDASFVRQAVPLLLGRKVKGYAERKLLVDFVGEIGRGRLIWALTQQPEAIAHWSEAWMDLLRVNRIDEKAQTQCYGPPLHAPDGGSLGRILRNRDPEAGPVVGIGTVNMTDIVTSSLEADDLTSIYRAHLFPMVEHNIPAAAEVTEGNLRGEVAQTFKSAYINRDQMCQPCHNPGFSTTGPQSGWARTFPLPGNPEQYLYGAPEQLEAFFRSDQLDGNTQPFGLDASCGTFELPAQLPPDTIPGPAVQGYDYGEDGSVWDLEQQLHTGFDKFRRFGLTRVGGVPMVQQDRSLAYLTSANIIDGVWQRVMGYPLTIANSYARNAGQRDLHLHLLEHHFIRRNFSPAHLLSGILTSPYFNRSSPAAGSGADPYDIPMVFDPWVAADPRVDPNPPSEGLHNAMTEAIHRYSARTLLYSTHVATGWPAPVVFPPSYSNELELARSMGQYLKDAEPGGNGVDFQGLLHWDTVAGGGQKPVGHAGPDWIDRLLTEQVLFDQANPGAPITLHDLAQTVRDWLLGDGTLDPDEVVVLEDLFGQPLTTEASAVSPNELEDQLRGLMGVYLESPQFMLAGLAPTDMGPEPRLRVCNGGSCTYLELCETLRPSIEGLRYQVTCNADSIEVLPQVSGPVNPYGFAHLMCNNAPCVFENLDVYADCFQEPWLCPRLPPLCDPRCLGEPMCCGDGFLGDDPRGMFLLWGEGGVIEETNGIRILPAGGEEYFDLEDGYMLESGDLLELPPGSNITIGLEQGPWATPEEGTPENPELGSWLVMITGPSVLEAGAVALPEPVEGELDWGAYVAETWRQWGEGGQPQQGPPGM